MRNILSALLLFTYLLAVAGLDVHHCSDSGKSYLVLPALGMSCECIHPDDECPEECCGEEDDCCSDTIFRISVTGDSPANASFTPVYSQLDFGIIQIAPSIDVPSPAETACLISSGNPPGTFIIKYCVLRV